MKTRNITILLVVLLALVLALTWYGKKQPDESTVRTDSAPPITNEVPIQATNGHSVLRPPISNSLAASVHQRVIPAPRDKVAVLTEIFSANDVDIVFYGKVQDQFSNAVGNAKINFSVRHENLSGAGVERGQIVADSVGLFTISGYKGQDISVVPEKPGYAPVSMEGSGNYSPVLSPENQRAHPDPKNPVIIKMWKLQGPEPLTGINQRYKLPYTSAPINFDLLTGQVVASGGDLRIMVNRPAGVISGQNRLDWSLQIEAVAGGLIDAAGRERITYSAPESGYQPSVTVSASTNGHGVELIQQGLFVQSRNGQVYSKVGISFRINSEPDGLMYINFSGIANANGSRNWEGDPNTMNPAAQ